MSVPDQNLIRQINQIKEDIRKLKRFNRVASVNPATPAVAAASSNPNHAHAEHLLVSNSFNSPLLWYSNTPQLRLQHNANQYTQYDALGQIDFGSDPQQKQASIYCRRGEAGGVGDLPSDIIFDIIPDGSTSLVTAMELLYSRRVTLNGITNIYNKTGDAEVLRLYDNSNNLIHYFEIDGDYTVSASQAGGLQHIIQNTSTNLAAFTEWFGGVNTSNTEAVSIGAAISGYSGSYYGDYAWIGGRNRDLYLFTDGGGSDNNAIHFATGTGPTAVTSRGNINASGLILSTGARINEFSTDGTLSGDSDLAVPTEKAVKTYADTKLANVVEDTTPQLGGELDAQGNNIIDLADITFRTGVSGGTLRTGTSAADKFILQGYDVDGAAYVDVLEVDAGNTVTMDLLSTATIGGVQIANTGSVTQHSDVSNAGSGQIITSTERSSIDQLGLYNETSIVVKYAAMNVVNVDYNYQQQAANSGLYVIGSYSSWVYFTLAIPHYIIRWAEENSKTITATTVDMNWNDTDGSDYIDRVIVYHLDVSTGSPTSKLDQGTNLGSTTSGVRSDSLDFTDTVLAVDDQIIIRALWAQTTSASIRIMSFHLTLTFS